jgi:iron complex transport system permease protein
MIRALLAQRRAPLTAPRLALVTGLLLFLLLALCLIAVSTGTVSLPVTKVLGILTGTGESTEAERLIILGVRLPRILLALCVGSGLSVAGLVFQALLRNPLAEPYILGISSGGTVGTLLALALALGTVGTSALSFAGSGLVMLLVYSIAQRRGQMDTSTLLLAGVMIGAFFNAVVLVMIALLHQELRNAFLWLMGNLGNANPGAVELVAPLLLIATAVLFSQARNYNLIATGDEGALQLGVNVRVVKRLSYIIGSFLTGVVVSVSGVVGFVGLIIPHICRMLFGPDHRILLPASFLLGASFLVLADLLSRTLLAPVEIPVGAVTAAIGAPVFIYLLRKS